MERGKKNTSFFENSLASKNVISLISFFSQLPCSSAPGCQEEGRSSLEDFREAQRKGVGDSKERWLVQKPGRSSPALPSWPRGRQQVTEFSDPCFSHL